MARKTSGDHGSRKAPPPSDPDNGIWQGQRVARRFDSPDGMIILVGKTARDNDVLSLKIGTHRDFWLHVATGPGSHVVVRNPENLDRLPRATQQMAAALAVRHSKSRAGGRTAVHLSRCSEIAKPRGYAAGKVTLGRYSTVHASPYDGG